MQITLLAAGSNARGQLATGNDEDAWSFKPCRFDTLPEDIESVLRIASGANHTLILLARSEGVELWGCGDGSKGQLGPGAEGGSMVFKRMRVEHPSLKMRTVKDVAAAWETTYVVMTDGNTDTVLAMGGNDRGALGVRDGTPGVPQIVDIARSIEEPRFVVTQISAGPMHVMLTVRTETAREFIVGWGASRHGQLNTRLDETSPAVVYTPRIVLSSSDAANAVTSLALGNQHSVFLRASRLLESRGSDRVAQLRGLDAFLDARAVGCTWNGTYVLDTAGNLLSTGKNNKGQLGRSNTGETAPLGPVAFPSDRQISQFACGSEHVLVMAEADGKPEVWGWGWNEHGNLGTGGTDDVRTPQKLWPLKGADGQHRAVGVWAGCGTSYLIVQSLGDNDT